MEPGSTQNLHFRPICVTLGLPRRCPIEVSFWSRSAYRNQRKPFFLLQHWTQRCWLFFWHKKWLFFWALGGHAWTGFPLEPLLYTQDQTSHGHLRLLWIQYNPCAMLSDHDFCTESFSSLCNLAAGGSGVRQIPKLKWGHLYLHRPCTTSSFLPNFIVGGFTWMNSWIDWFHLPMFQPWMFAGQTMAIQLPLCASCGTWHSFPAVAEAHSREQEGVPFLKKT